MLGSLSKAIPQKIFFLLFSCIPLWFSWGFFPKYYKALESDAYEGIECTLLVNQRRKISYDEVNQIVRYRYQYDGRTFYSDVYRWDMSGYSDNRRFVDRRFRKRRPGETVNCFVNPRNPAQAVIERGAVTPWYHIGFLLLLDAFGLWGLFTAFFRPGWAEENMQMDGDVT